VFEVGGEGKIKVLNPGEKENTRRFFRARTAISLPSAPVTNFPYRVPFSAPAPKLWTSRRCASWQLVVTRLLNYSSPNATQNRRHNDCALQHFRKTSWSLLRIGPCLPRCFIMAVSFQVDPTGDCTGFDQDVINTAHNNSSSKTA